MISRQEISDLAPPDKCTVQPDTQQACVRCEPLSVFYPRAPGSTPTVCPQIKPIYSYHRASIKQFQYSVPHLGIPQALQTQHFQHGSFLCIPQTALLPVIRKSLVAAQTSHVTGLIKQGMSLDSFLPHLPHVLNHHVPAVVPPNYLLFHLHSHHHCLGSIFKQLSSVNSRFLVIRPQLPHPDLSPDSSISMLQYCCK